MSDTDQSVPLQKTFTESGSPKGPDLYRLSLSSKSLTSIESLYPKGRYLYRVSLTKGTPTCNEYVPDPCPECLLQKVPDLY